MDKPKVTTSPRPAERTETGSGADEAADVAGAAGRADTPAAGKTVFSLEDVSVHYGDFTAVKGVSLDVPQGEIVAFIGPSGCGKSTMLRSLNRMNDLVPSARVDGQVRYHGVDIYDEEVDPVEVRRRIGMVFQKPNPFPKSIYENVVFGPKVNGQRDGLEDLVEESLRSAALWDEVKDKLDESAYALSGGQQQRLCIARAIATRPDVILMDEPCSALDPIATLKIEDLMRELRRDYTIVIVTHNMQQAARVSDRTAFFSLEEREDGAPPPPGILIEYAETDHIFTQASDDRTEAYITGRFG